MKKLILITLSLFLSCTHSVHHFNAGDSILPQKKESMIKITAQSEQLVILSFVYDTNYVEKAIEDLRNQCKDGWIHSIGTRFSTSLGFFHWTNKLYLEAYCNK
ncbi:MAG: hypothetical protein IPL26_02730 [Leptospiraceae bacterium]|nr:hypothetical protein [Leptospiraceae bacterium]